MTVHYRTVMPARSTLTSHFFPRLMCTTRETRTGINLYIFTNISYFELLATILVQWTILQYRNSRYFEIIEFVFLTVDCNFNICDICSCCNKIIQLYVTVLGC